MACEIPIDRLEAHPSNANVMPEERMKKLERHIASSGRYEALVVRPFGGTPEEPRHQVLNGHHRLEVLRRLGHRTVRCEVWDVDDGEALMLLATLNRLEGRDDPARRAALLVRLSEGQGGGDLSKLARLLPEDRAALDRALALAREPLPVPAAPERSPAAFSPMTFFLTGEEHETVSRALKLAGRAAKRGQSRGTADLGFGPSQASGSSGGLGSAELAIEAGRAVRPSDSGGGRKPGAGAPGRGRSRAAALVAMAECFLAQAGGVS